jgi:protein-S-isoprenylcysteine O-methyltransferase Ste14
MEPIPFTVLPAMVLFDGLLLLAALGEVGIRAISARNSAGQRGRPEWTSFVLILVSFVIGLGGAFFAATHATASAIPVGRWPLFTAGMVIMAAGVALRWWSVAVLGRSFTVQVRVRDGQQVVDRGPFAVVRHPSYTGLMFVFLGTGLALGNWIALIVAVVPPVAAIVYRIHVEESTLSAALGEPYVDYRRRVRFRLIPGVY